MKINICKLIILFFLFGVGNNAFAQKKLKSYLNYIDDYYVLAVRQMVKYKIPASITLSQALLESGAGLSELSRSSNNHFGIKCHADWTGDRIYRRDDNPNDCFRVYSTVEDSYEDHSMFLAQHPRYAVLFSYGVKDYESWARGLQECGYATDKGYANKLITYIEDYELYKYDYFSQSTVKSSSGKQQPRMRPTYITYGLLYVEAEANDSFEKIAYDMGFKVKNLLKYNDVPAADFPLKKGDVVYLEKKKKKADKPHSLYVVKVGDSMHRISQHYGIRLKNLYKINKKKSDFIPTEGDVLKLR